METKTAQRFKIARIGKADAFYRDRALLIGEKGTATKKIERPYSSYVSCNFHFDQIPKGFGRKSTSFYRVLLKKIPPLDK